MQSSRHDSAAEKIIRHEARKHFLTLSQKLNQSIIKDSYGRHVSDTSQQELDLFLNGLQFSVRKIGIKAARSILLDEIRIIGSSINGEQIEEQRMR